MCVCDFSCFVKLKSNLMEPPGFTELLFSHHNMTSRHNGGSKLVVIYSTD